LETLMPRFYFHLVTPAGCEWDEIGSDCASAEAAYLEARQSAMEICADAVRRGPAPTGYRYEVCDEAHRQVLELAFSDLLATPVRPRSIARDALQTRLTETMRRSHTLQAELAATVAEAHATLTQTRALLKGQG